MANRVTSAPLDADNSSSSFTPAACNDWRTGVRRFHVGTGHTEPTSDAGYTTAGSPLLPKPISLFLLGGSPYTLGVQARANHNKAACALANKLARICYATLRDSQPYGLPAPRFNHKIERTAFAVAT